MNILPNFSRAYKHTNVHQNLPFRITATSTTLSRTSRKQQLRSLSSNAIYNAQPIRLDPSTSTTSPSPEITSLASDILSRAPTDSEPITPSQPSLTTTNLDTDLNALSNTSPFLCTATVTRTGTMKHTVQLTQYKQTFDKYLQKHYTRPHRLLAHDPSPAGFLREGDVVEFGLFSASEQAAKEAKRVALETRLISEGKIRTHTKAGRALDLSVIGVKKRGPRWVVRRVVTAFGTAVEGRDEEVRLRAEQEVGQEQEVVVGGRKKKQQQQRRVRK